MRNRSPQDIGQLRDGVRRLGAHFDDTILAATRSLYVEHVDPTPVAHEHVDQRYGEHERHRLDLYSAGGSNLPVVVFVHGGGFIGGDKNGEGGFYANVGRYFATQGYTAVTMTYRLAPENAWPDAMQDVAMAMDWVNREIATYGGDAARVALVGQSAGASHAASFLFDPQTASQAAQQVRAAALLSGFYRARAPLSPGQAAYFGKDESEYGRRSPASHTGTNASLPLLLTVAEFDPPRLTQQTLEFATSLAASRGPCPPLHWFAGHNHVSTVMSLGTQQTEVGDRLCEFLAAHLAPG